jgi:hypothetical protein
VKTNPSEVEAGNAGRRQMRFDEVVAKLARPAVAATIIVVNRGVRA